ncbi:uncharacterized protein MONBRDRAFT_7910 [Monosiga brevicollis MX1]|uniref:Sulfatase N-terminal domain-containing protein n=1 Tax=Monosiga brevicollis TaxID=81824 RepID=A9UYG0_MONBE|nr:uncharacterized protein MONBRDRAFT_7910 [Monosiga brevicollis MX1]EDQ89600.1 predicted protein [Monosiga brevicollis MX1]|eukprot:XP_001745629.1 hypothetical protein [Monosiga brevicollis MX1]
MVAGSLLWRRVAGCCLLLVAAGGCSVGAESNLPSFLFVLGDDIGWADFGCNCRQEWSKDCLYGHYEGTNHCQGGEGPGGNNCCFNYWWPNASAAHAVSNYSQPIPQDDSLYLTDSFYHFLAGRDGAPFLAQISFHNCHIPYIGTPEARADCAAGRTCRPGNYSDAQLDFYACLNELDAAVGRLLTDLETFGYRNNTMMWVTTDNGPEGNCEGSGDAAGRCEPEHFLTYPGSAGPLRGRKRDIFEGGHRVPGIVSWPAVVPRNMVSWDTVVTMDFMATIMDVLDVQRPASQAQWAFDGQSIMPILTGEGDFDLRGIGWMYQNPSQHGYRYGRWKFVNNSQGCKPSCTQGFLYDLETDMGETTDLSSVYPDVFSAIVANYTAWFESVMVSRTEENDCHGFDDALQQLSRD